MTTKKPRNLSNAELYNIVVDIRNALWPNDDPHFEWSPDTLDEIASILAEKGLRPEEKK